MGDEVGMGVDVESEWGKVVERYRSNPEAHTRKISGYKSGTALHGALEKNEHQVAQHLLKAILSSSKVKEALEMEDESGDTALHVAASKGFVGVCRLIIGGKEERKSLVKKKNKKGETPLFLAALGWNRKKHVNKYTVAYLIDVLGDEYTIFDLVRDDGDTILHSAIRYQYFDLAVILLHRYDSLLDIGVRANGRGITPLKALAAVPSAFRSANEISGWKLVLYHCIVAEPVDPDTAMRSYLEKAANDKFLNFVRKQKNVFPDNYTIVRLLYDSMRRGVRRIIYWLCNDCSGVEKASKDTESVDTEGNYDHGGFPPNYFTLKQFINFVIRCFAVFYGLGAWGYDEVRMKKMKHKYSHQLLKLLMKNPNLASGDGLGRKPTGDFNDVLGQSYTDYFDEVHGLQQSNNQGESSGKKVGWAEEEEIEESAFVTAVRNGIVEMVNEILKVMPNAMYDKSKKGENVFWVAVKKRQPFVIEELKRRSNADRILEDFINGAVDGEDNILHLAAHSIAEDQPAQIAGVALQMMWDTSWYEYIKEQVPQYYEYLLSKKAEKGEKDEKVKSVSHKTPMQIFKVTHKELMEKSSEWLKDTSESCSVVATLIAGVSFATAYTIPGGNGEKGSSPFKEEPAFNAFAISSLIGLCFSVTALTMFLSILTSRKEARDFRKSLPMKLLVGLSALFISIVAMFVSFCSGHYFLVNKNYQGIVLLLYAATVFPVIFFAAAQLPLYYDLLETFLTKVPNKAKGIGTSF